MARKFTLRIGMLLFSVFLLSSVNFLSAAERTRNCSTPLYLHIPNNGLIVKGSEVVVHVQLDMSKTVKSIEIVGANGVMPVNVISDFRKDGKVDVDIIIRGENFLPFLYPYSTGPSAQIRIANINYITVDNISGVFTTNTNPTTDVSSRLINVTVNDGLSAMEPEGNGASNEASISTGFVSVNSVSTSISIDESKALVSDNVTLFPNPIRDNILNLNFAIGNTNIQGIRVFNAVGAMVYQDLTKQAVTGNHIVQLPILPAGVYFVRVVTETNEIVKKFNITR